MNDEDETHFREFVATRYDNLRALAYLTCGDWHTAEDAVSASLAKLYVRWRKVEQPLAYARQSVVRALIDESRRPWRRREKPVGDSMPDLVGPDSSAQVDERIRLRAALLRMPAGQRAVLVLRFFEGLSVEQTAEVLGRQPGTVKSQTARGLTTLREILRTDDIQITTDFDDGKEEHDVRPARAAGHGQGRRAATAA